MKEALNAFLRGCWLWRWIVTAILLREFGRWAYLRNTPDVFVRWLSITLSRPDPAIDRPDHEVDFIAELRAEARSEWVLRKYQRLVRRSA